MVDTISQNKTKKSLFVSKFVELRLEQHEYNLKLWEDGTLNPTEPSKLEREITKRELRAVIYELKLLINSGYV